MLKIISFFQLLLIVGHAEEIKLPNGLSYEEFLRCRGLPCKDYQNKLAAISEINNLLLNGTYEEKSTVKFHFNNDVLDGCVRLNARQTQNLVTELRELNHDDKPTRSKRHIIDFGRFGNRKWRVTTIQYKIQSDYTDEYVRKLEDSLRHIEEKTCFVFQKVRNSQEINDDHIIFSNAEKACWAYIGRVAEGSYPQLINLHERCIDFFGIPVHEVIHALGFWHQHQRPDRNNYIKLNCDLINNGCSHDQMKVPSDVTEPKIPYDYNSVMHYSGFSNANDRNRLHQFTIQALDSRHQKSFGQRQEMSFLDAKVIHNEYCNDKCGPSPPACKFGGFPNSKDCSKCICPDGLGGNLCQTVGPSHSQCGNSGERHLHEGDRLEIYSPNYFGNGYTSGQNCNWKITTDPGYKIKITFSSPFGIHCYGSQDGSGAPLEECHYHWVEVKYDEDMSKNGYRQCCQRTPTPIISKGRIMVVSFRSIDKDGGRPKGFRAEISLVRSDGAPVVTKTTRKPTTSTPRPTTVTTKATTTSTKKPTTTPKRDGIRWSEWTDCSTRSCQCGGCDFTFRFRICPNGFSDYQACTGDKFGLEMKRCFEEERTCGPQDKYPIFIGRLFYLRCTECCSDYQKKNGRCVKRDFVNSLTGVSNETEIPDVLKYHVDNEMLKFNQKKMKVLTDNLNNGNVIRTTYITFIASVAIVLFHLI